MRAIQASEVNERVQNVREGKLRSDGTLYVIISVARRCMHVLIHVGSQCRTHNDLSV